MSMAQEVVLMCDVCGKRGTPEDEVVTMVVANPHYKAWEIDVCDSCYQEKYRAPAKSRPSTRSAGKPQVRFKITELPPQPSDDQ